MSRKLEGREGAILGDPSIEGRFADLKQRAERMEGLFDRGTSEDFSIAAWHLIHDLIPKSKEVRHRLAQSKVVDKKLPAEMLHVRNTLRDIANSAKHGELDPGAALARVIAYVEPGQTKGWLSYLFHERILGVTTEDGYYFSVRKLRDLTMCYLSWVFDDNIPVKSFPGELLGRILVCKIANRSAGAVPPAGAILPLGGDPGFVTKKPGST